MYTGFMWLWTSWGAPKPTNYSIEYEKMLRISFYDIVGQCILTNHTILYRGEMGIVTTVWLLMTKSTSYQKLDLFWAQLDTNL